MIHLPYDFTSNTQSIGIHRSVDTADVYLIKVYYPVVPIDLHGIRDPGIPNNSDPPGHECYTEYDDASPNVADLDEQWMPYTIVRTEYYSNGCFRMLAGALGCFNHTSM